MARRRPTYSAPSWWCAATAFALIDRDQRQHPSRQIQTAINAHARYQAEDAYQQVRSTMARATAELQHTGGAKPEALSPNLLGWLAAT